MTTENEHLFGIDDMDEYVREIEANPLFKIAETAGVGIARTMAVCSILSDAQDILNTADDTDDDIQHMINRAKFLLMKWYLPEGRVEDIVRNNTQ